MITNNLTSPSQVPTAEFVRHFFAFLENQGVVAAALQGWQDGFEGELSDVDFVIEPRGFARIAALVYEHCQAEGWLLCQILRHETTAAYCICVSTTEPMQVVALDACSDYQRNGMFFLKSEELLDDTLAMPWGGKRINEENHLLYRVLKAAGKVKDVEQASLEFLSFPAATRVKVAATIEHKWGVLLDSWDAAALQRQLPILSKRSFSVMAAVGPAALWRGVKRLIRPTGMVVMTSPEIPLTSLREQLAPLFRKCKESKNPGPALLWDVVKSTCCFVIKMPSSLPILLPGACRVDVRGERTSKDISEQVVAALHRRCLRWETR